MRYSNSFHIPALLGFFPSCSSFPVLRANYVKSRWDDAPYSLADRGAFLGLATDGEQEFCLYAVKGDEEESCIYCFWDWEGFFYRKA